MTLIVIGCSAPIVLTRGSWPVHALADLRLIVFGECLPEQGRRGKRLDRERLFRCGFDHDVAYPQIREVFTGVMDQGLRDYGADLGLHGSRPRSNLQLDQPLVFCFSLDMCAFPPFGLLGDRPHPGHIVWVMSSNSRRTYLGG
jgi:hypothetical protein